MTANLVIEIVLGIITLMAGSLFWQLHKRGNFLMRAIHDGPFLAQIISPSALDNPSSMVAPYIEKMQPGYVLNIQILIDADTKTQRFSKLIFGFLVAAALIGSYIIGVTYFVINAVIFFLSGLASVSQQARANAAQQIMSLAVILDRWHSENAAECEQWIKLAWSLRPLYDAVVEARGNKV
jgi:hypothetical protein